MGWDLGGTVWEGNTELCALTALSWFLFLFSSPQGIFIKDSNSLAYYNMTSGSLIHLALKERGGRKK